jgi:prepilin-type N-terminal cleavage/methylation domain-containing protein
MEVIMKQPIKTPRRNFPEKMARISKNGMTLIEIMVSLVILLIILGSVYSLLNMQQTKATNVQQTSILQTDAQVAGTIFRWDIFMAGYGLSMDDNSIIPANSAVQPDQITLRGMGLSFESHQVDWTPVVEIAQATNDLKVYRFNDSTPDYSVGDNVLIVDQEKKIIEANLTILDIDTLMHHPSPTDSFPALNLHLSRAVSASMGCLVFRPNPASLNGITYTLVNGRLMRGNEVFLENVEDVQFAYAVDLNNNGVFDATEWYNDLNAVPGYNPKLLYQHKSAVRTTIVAHTEKALTDFNAKLANITVEDHTYPLSPTDQKRKREFVNAISWPRNLQY